MKLYRLCVRHADEVTGLGGVISRKIVPAYAYHTKGKTYVTTSKKTADHFNGSAKQ